MDKLRVAIYARISTKNKRQDRRRRHTYQLEELRHFISRKGWAPAGEYIDRTPGKNSDRPKFHKIFQDAADGKFDVVLFWSLRRFSCAGASATIHVLGHLTEHGVNWCSFKEESLRSIGIWPELFSFKKEKLRSFGIFSEMVISAGRENICDWDIGFSNESVR